MISRGEFEARRKALGELTRRETNGMAVYAVGLGIAQLALLRWAETHLTSGATKAVGGTAFLLYMAGLIVLVARLSRHQRALRPRCPHCAAILAGISERVLAATGNCDRCGGRVIGDSAPGDDAPAR